MGCGSILYGKGGNVNTELSKRYVHDSNIVLFYHGFIHQLTHIYRDYVDHVSGPGSAFIKPDQRNPWIKDQIKITLLPTISHLLLPNFVSCGRACPSHMTQNLVTVGAKLWTTDRFIVDPWSMDYADPVWYKWGLQTLTYIGGYIVKMHERKRKCLWCILTKLIKLTDVEFYRYFSLTNMWYVRIHFWKNDINFGWFR